MPTPKRSPRSPKQETPATPQPRRRLISDARTMRALAHPVRVALLEVMRRDGEITATRAAELLGESPGNMSWHLQTLAKYGFVEEAGGGRGRSRPWRVTRDTQRFDTGIADPEAAAAGEALERTFLQRANDQMDEWRLRRRDYPVKWRRAAFISASLTYLTHEELSAISDEVAAIYARYPDRDDPERRPPGALPVQLFAQGHPLPPTPSGN
jgi:DNA-binding transcriptional ArsR family regulator